MRSRIQISPFREAVDSDVSLVLTQNPVWFRVAVDLKATELRETNLRNSSEVYN